MTTIETGAYIEAKNANHPNRSNYRYFKVCPRGFANEITYLRIPLDKIIECEATFANYENDHYEDHGHCGWTADKHAREPGVAIDWVDRAYVGL